MAEGLKGNAPRSLGLATMALAVPTPAVDSSGTEKPDAIALDEPRVSNTAAARVCRRAFTCSVNVKALRRGE